MPRMQPDPNRFRVLLRVEEVNLNESLNIDKMYIDGRALLHVVEEGTKFSAALLLDAGSSTTIGTILIDCWASIYDLLHNRIHADKCTPPGPGIHLHGRTSGRQC